MVDLTTVTDDEIVREVNKRTEERNRALIKGAITNLVEAEARGDILRISRATKGTYAGSYFITIKQHEESQE